MTTKLIIKSDRKTYDNDESRVSAYQRILSTEEGQIFLKDFLINMGFFSVEETTDANQAFINMGKRIACNYLLNFTSITNIKKESSNE